MGEVGESLEKTWYYVFEVSPFIVDRGKLTSGLYGTMRSLIQSDVSFSL